MFQRAKIIAPDFDESHRGRLIWVQVGPPIVAELPALNAQEGYRLEPDNVVTGEWYITHLRVSGQKHSVYIDKDFVELLAESAEDVDPEFI